MPADGAPYCVGPSFRGHGQPLAIDLHRGGRQGEEEEGGRGGEDAGPGGEHKRDQSDSDMDVEEDQSDSDMDVEEYWGKADHFRDDEGLPAVGGQPTLPVYVAGKVMRP